MDLPAWLFESIDEVEASFTRRLPASLARALDSLTEGLKRERGWDPAVALPSLALASRAAFPGEDFPAAREHFDAALAEIGVTARRSAGMQEAGDTPAERGEVRVS